MYHLPIFMMNYWLGLFHTSLVRVYDKIFIKITREVYKYHSPRCLRSHKSRKNKFISNHINIYFL